MPDPDPQRGERSASSEPGHADWLNRYGEYLTRTADQSAKILRLYEELMDHFASGVLEPSVLQDSLTPFAQARGPAFAGRLSDLSMRFFAGLVQVGTAYFHDLAEGVAPDSGKPPEPPPAFDAQDPASSLRELTEYANRLRDQAMSAYQSMLEKVAAGEISPESVTAASSDHLGRRLPEHLRKLGTLYFDLLAELGDVRASYEEEYLEGVLASARRDSEEADSSLHLRAPLGETAVDSISLENTRREAIEIRCAATDVRRADGVDPAFAPAIEISPRFVELGPGEEAKLEVSLQLLSDAYVPDALYVGALEITRSGAPPLEVPLRILAEAPASGDEPSGEGEDAT